MKYVCDGPGGKTWFRIESEAEAEQESALLQHAVEKHFRREMEKAKGSYKPTSTVFIEQNIGLEAHLQRAMPVFLTLRLGDGSGLATAMLPPGGGNEPSFKIVIVGVENSDPYRDHADAIAALGQHYGLTLDRESCFPYGR